MNPGEARSRHSLPLAVAAVALLIAALLAAFTPAFQQNDDVVMAMIASGRGVAAQGDAHLVFMNVLAGELLRRAYAWAPAWPWYGSLLVCVAALAQVALLHARRRPLAYLAWFTAVGATSVVRLQFTSVAGLAAGTGLALWVAGLGTPPEPGRARAAAALPALLLLLGGVLRFDALLLALVVGLPLALDRLLRLDRRRALAAAGGLGAVLALALALHVVDRAAYARDPGWSDFLELNSWRARVVDYGAGGDGAERRALESRLGWSENDGVALRRWLYPDRSVFPVEKLRALVQAAPALRPGAAEAWARVREAFSYPSFLPLALVLPLLVVAGAVRSGLRVLLLTLVPAAVVVTALAVFLRAPEHVGLPALAFVPTALLAASDDGPRRGGWAARGGALVLAAAAALLALRQHHAGSVAAGADNRDLRESVALLARDRLYVEWAGAFRYEAVLPLEDASYLSGLRLFSLGWPQRSPIADAVLRERGIDDVLRALLERDDVGLLMNPAWQEVLAAYAREHYGATIRLAETTRTPSFTVFRVERADAAAGEGGRSSAAGR